MLSSGIEDVIYVTCRLVQGPSGLFLYSIWTIVNV